jgi:hypothetical protein
MHVMMMNARPDASILPSAGFCTPLRLITSSGGGSGGRGIPRSTTGGAGEGGLPEKKMWAQYLELLESHPVRAPACLLVFPCRFWMPCVPSLPVLCACIL